MPNTLYPQYSSSVFAFCNKCGAPIVVPTVWHGTIPPTPQYTCGCHSNFGMQWQGQPVNKPTYPLIQKWFIYKTDGTFEISDTPPVPLTDSNEIPHAKKRDLSQEAMDKLASEFEKEFADKKTDSIEEKLDRLNDNIEKILKLLSEKTGHYPR